MASKLLSLYDLVTDTGTSCTSSGTFQPSSPFKEYNYTIRDNTYTKGIEGRTISKAEYELLLLRISELGERLDQMEERERSLIKLLMEKNNGADDKDAS